MFYIGELNTGNTFLAYFIEHNQTDENVFIFIKYTWKLFYMLPNIA